MKQNKKEIHRPQLYHRIFTEWSIVWNDSAAWNIDFVLIVNFSTSTSFHVLQFNYRNEIFQLCLEPNRRSDNSRSSFNLDRMVELSSNFQKIANKYLWSVLDNDSVIFVFGAEFTSCNRLKSITHGRGNFQSILS